MRSHPCSSHSLIVRPLALVLALLLAACSNTGPIKARRRAGDSLSGTSFKAGAAKVDITPLPGIPMGGFGPAGRIGRGSWMPLYSRATYLEDARGSHLILVVCDLWAMPGGLADRVAQLVDENVKGISIDRSEIIVAATHTHHSPGNFSSFAFYNEHASADEGFDRGLFDFLAAGIATSVIRAIENARPARAYYSSQMMPGVARNRSLEPFLMDPESAQLPAEAPKRKSRSIPRPISNGQRRVLCAAPGCRASG